MILLSLVIVAVFVLQSENLHKRARGWRVALGTYCVALLPWLLVDGLAVSSASGGISLSNMAHIRAIEESRGRELPVV